MTRRAPQPKLAVLRLGLFALALLACHCAPTPAQDAAPKDELLTIIHGRVLNKVTNAPVVRALVSAEDYATLTDDQGQFEFKIQVKDAHTDGAVHLERLVEAKKPFFLEGSSMVTSDFPEGATQSQSHEITIYLIPEALIVGHVDIPGTQGEVRIQCQLYRRTITEGQESWSPSGTFRTWADGEFRFGGLRAGVYKLITNEQIDRDSMVPTPGAQLFGYPPIYYPNTTDFSAATPIVVKAGDTAEVNLTVSRRPYYPVRIAISNPPASGPVSLTVYPMGHHSPGWSLGHNLAEHTIAGMLPDGNYTVEARELSGNYSPDPGGPHDPQSAGILNFAVKGRSVEGPTLTMVLVAPIPVNVHEGSQSQPQQALTMTRRYEDGHVEQHPAPRVDVTLTSLDSFGPQGTGFTRLAPGSDGHSLLIDNVFPGRYRVHVRNVGPTGYAASVESGGVDLLTQPLVVAWGGGASPIEITMRDDGATITGTVDDPSTESVAPQQLSFGAKQIGRNESIYLISLGADLGGQTWQTGSFESKFRFDQIPPGDYLLLAFSQFPTDFPGEPEELESLKSKGKIIHADAGQTITVRVPVIPPDQQDQQ